MVPDFPASSIILSLGSLLFRTVPSDCTSFPVIGHGLRCGIEFNGGVQLRADYTHRSSGALQRPAGCVPLPRDGPHRRCHGAGGPPGHSPNRGLVQTGVLPTASSSCSRRRCEATGSRPTASVSRPSATTGDDVSAKAVTLVIFLIVIVAFISWRFEWKMAIARLLALFHDLIVTAGVYSLAGFEVTPSTIVAILTILGYSLYDTVVVFDKLEENATMFASTGRMTYQDSANLAMNQVFMRSLNTSLATLLPVTALLVVGTGLWGRDPQGPRIGTAGGHPLGYLLVDLRRYSDPVHAEGARAEVPQHPREGAARCQACARPAPAAVGAVAVGAGDGSDVPAAAMSGPTTTIAPAFRTGSALFEVESRVEESEAPEEALRPVSADDWQDHEWLKSFIRDVPDWPIAGVVFKDITPLLGDKEAFPYTINTITEHFGATEIDKVLGVEAERFHRGSSVAYRFRAGLVPVRKKGKLPWEMNLRSTSSNMGPSFSRCTGTRLCRGSGS